VAEAYATGYGGNTPCLEIDAAGQSIIIDAGTGIRGAGQALVARGVEQIIEIKLSSEEDAALKKSAASVKELVDVIGV